MTFEIGEEGEGIKKSITIYSKINHSLKKFLFLCTLNQEKEPQIILTLSGYYN